MYNFFNKKGTHEDKLYNKILSLSRNKFFFTEMALKDTFQNRINLIFLHISFIIIKIKDKSKSSLYKDFYQKLFDHVFKRIETNMREIGFGDVTVNKNMKFLTKSFYNILLNCENYKSKSKDDKIIFLRNYLKSNNPENKPINSNLIKYFDKYHSFCLDLSSDNVLKGDLEFKIN
tara:strand:- start:462 stop:986 length:525 start_codon:yes stop_codon:yes gene_type:complete